LPRLKLLEKTPRRRKNQVEIKQKEIQIDSRPGIN
jgi:hypothetical protein